MHGVSRWFALLIGLVPLVACDGERQPGQVGVGPLHWSYTPLRIAHPE